MKIYDVPRLHILGEIMAALSVLARDLDGPDPIARKDAQRNALDALRSGGCQEDEALYFVRFISEGRIRCRQCKDVFPMSRADSSTGMCREHTRQLLAASEPQ